MDECEKPIIKKLPSQGQPTDIGVDCDRPPSIENPTPFQAEQSKFEQDFKQNQAEFEEIYADKVKWNNIIDPDSSAQEYTSFLEYKKELFRKKELAKNCTPLKISGTKGVKRRFCVCPVCSRLNRVKDKVGGKNYFKIPFTNIKIPRFDHLFDKIVTFDANRRPGEVCGICGGSKQIPDVTDDAPLYAEVAQRIDENAEKIMEAEAKLGLGGTRTTIIQGSDLLFVGLGFNTNKTYEVLPDAAIAPAMRGGKIPQQNGTPVNAVVGKQGSLGWPQQVGNYTIKCANKFNMLAGAGGITMATPGPLTISAGLMKIVGPQLSIGSSTGPLTLEGDSVNITGRAVSITPTGGELFVKGSINNTGNTTTLGHAHFESASFVKASCVGTTKSTMMANGNQDVTVTQPATWSGFAAAAALLDLQTYYQNILTDFSTSAFRLLSPKEQENIADRMAAIAKYAIPLEKLPTGFVVTGTPITFSGTGAATCPCNQGGTAGGAITLTNIAGTILAPVPLFNFPHTHGIPEMQHKHEIVLPDIDITSGSPVALRGKVINGAHESGVPANPTKDTFARFQQIGMITAEFAANIATEAIKLASKVQRLFT